jgi:hypothetical protein
MMHLRRWKRKPEKVGMRPGPLFRSPPAGGGGAAFREVVAWTGPCGNYTPSTNRPRLDRLQVLEDPKIF